MGQAESTVRQIREIYELMDELSKLAAVADSGFVAKAGDMKFPLPPDKVETLKAQFADAKDRLRAKAGGLQVI